MAKPAPLSILPLSSIIRSLAITTISSSPVLLPPSLAITAKLAHSTSPILSPDSNPVLRFILKHTFYRQFCAGETPTEVKQTIDALKTLGFKGVILGYAREVVMDEAEADKLKSCGEYETVGACIRQEITPWAKGTIETVKLASPGDFVALKFTGAGSQALYDLKQQADPSPALKEAIDSVCDMAAARGIRLLFDAEQQAIQAGIDAWTLDYMRKYNKGSSTGAVVYGTYQAYLKATPSILASHLAFARKEGFPLGVKLVRGAYLGSDPRHLIHDTKSNTDDAYNGIAASLAKRSYGPVLKAAEGETVFPPVNVVLAGHNHESVHKIQDLRTSQTENGQEQTDLVYAQLQGMADDISCDLVQAGQVKEGEKKVDIPKAYKYLVWGTTGECMKYLLRRANENKEAVQRTREGRDAMAAELMRRCKKVVGLA
ncbi:FAD-linked oxidoreductase-like protein [Amylocarpus encephaloides]|uniref:Proline dehydrogenase n=1 Tax=Amylocarpus encephaloides TaxID=45428 RepID=A0A9P7YH21_9HELO|nr:FAD-linked oxidoreductase-like protein [Amylocarpus encephaloides]